MEADATAEVGLLFRAFLPAFFVTYILLGGPFAARRFRKRYGFDPNALKEPDPEFELGEAYRNGIFLVVLVFVMTYALWPGINGHLGPIDSLETPTARRLGVGVLIASLILVGTAQLQLGRSWRYGIDRTHPPDELVTKGLFGFSRNPIYVGMIATGWGLFLAVPNAITFAIANLVLALLHVRVRAEERFLAEVWGEEYERYRNVTPRWLPRPKR